MMSHPTEGSGASASPDRPTTDLVNDLAQRVSVLIRDELKLAQGK
jgi:hypothetical protein